MGPIILINPPVVDTRSMGKLDYDLTWSPPLGIAGIAAVLEQNGYEVYAFDFYYSEWNEVEETIRNVQPSVVGISVFSEQRASTYRLITYIRETLPSATIVLGGPHPTFLYEQLLTFFPVDACVIGEGEQTFLELIRALDAGQALSAVDGLAIRDGDRVVKTQPRQLIRNLDSLPLPAYHHFKSVDYESLAPRDWMQNFTIQGVPGTELKWTSAVASRGCPFNCHFCSTPATWGRGWRRFSPKRFVDELEWLCNDLEYKAIDFSDDIFTTDKKWVVEICKEMLNRDLSIAWNACTRVDCISQEMLDWMKAAGCLFVSYGIESFSPKVLDALNKRTTKERIERAVELTHLAGIETEFLLIVGSPGETDESINETIEFIKRTQPMIVSPSILTIFPGTTLYLQARADKFIDDDYWLTDKPTPYDLREHGFETLLTWYKAICDYDRSPQQHRVAALAEMSAR